MRAANKILCIFMFVTSTLLMIHYSLKMNLFDGPWFIDAALIVGMLGSIYFTSIPAGDVYDKDRLELSVLSKSAWSDLKMGMKNNIEMIKDAFDTDDLLFGLFVICLTILSLPFLLIYLVIYVVMIAILALISGLAVLPIRLLDNISYNRNVRCWVCPQCGAMKKRANIIKDSNILGPVRPGNRGIFRWETNSGSYVPCTSLTKKGRGTLDNICEDCKTRSKIQESMPLTISLAGASDSGKTSFAMASYKRLFDMRDAGVLTFADTYYSKSTQETTYMGYTHGLKTATDSGFLDPYIVLFGKNWKTPSALYYFDINGRYFGKDTLSSNINLTPQYSYNDGIVYTVNAVKSTADDENITFSRFLTRYHTNTGLSSNKKIQTPLAIVITFADTDAVIKPGLSSKAIVKELKKRGYANFINSVKNSADSYRFFAVNNMDTSSSDAPLVWICNSCKHKARSIM